ncbi:MAG TPA: hypothetical protein VFI42_02965 [Thermomicrobiaceae bacterium]|nr:hypothetical protein [Thermomicrobiaceae bacterium]
MSRRRGNAHKHAARQPARQQRASEATDDDAIAEWGEWLDHQYDPGYYTGGRIPPFLRNRGGSSLYGYLLLFFGGLGLLFGIAGLTGGQPASGLIIVIVISAALAAAGWRLSRGRGR